MASGDDPRAAAGRETPRETELTAAALRRLEQRLDQASEAAERLIAEAAAAAMRRPPAAGWQPRERPSRRAARAGRALGAPVGHGDRAPARRRPGAARSDPAGACAAPGRGPPGRAAGAPGPDRLVPGADGITRSRTRRDARHPDRLTPRWFEFGPSALASVRARGDKYNRWVARNWSPIGSSDERGA